MNISITKIFISGYAVTPEIVYTKEHKIIDLCISHYLKAGLNHRNMLANIAPTLLAQHVGKVCSPCWRMLVDVGECWYMLERVGQFAQHF